MWKNLFALRRYRALILALLLRELKARYRGSALGYMWSLVNPLFLLTVYSIVFVTFLPNRAESVQPYSAFLFSGLLPWIWFSSSLMESSNALIAGGNLIKKVMFPAEVLPIVSVLTNMVHFLLATPVLAVWLLASGRYPDPQKLLWLPLVIVIQLVFTVGLALFVAALSVHFRDVRDILANTLTLWFFATPIIYPWFQPGLEPYRLLLRLNPVMHLIVSYQEVLFFGPGPLGQKGWLAVMAIASLAVCLVGYWWFDRLRDTFAEEV